MYERTCMVTTMSDMMPTIRQSMMQIPSTLNRNSMIWPRFRMISEITDRVFSSWISRADIVRFAIVEASIFSPVISSF